MLQDLKEKALTVLVFTGIFLPVRLFFYTYVSQYWLGSFGLMTAILLATIYLARKDRLGFVGRIINKQVMSFSKGKYGTISLIFLIFWIYVYGLVIYGINNPPVEVKQEFVQVLNDTGVNSIETLSNAQSVHWSGAAEAYGILFSIIVIVIPNKISFTIYSILNDWTDGWLVHFATVFLIESVEILALVIFFRYKKFKGTVAK